MASSEGWFVAKMGLTVAGEEMRLSQLLLCRDAGQQDDLLARAGYIHPIGEGLYSLLPLGNRVLRRLNQIVRCELERVDAQEVVMPLLQPKWLWQRLIGDGGTRAETFGAQLFEVRGGTGDNWVLGPTHEEVATLLGAACIRGPRDLPQIIYQIQPRFRDHQFTARQGLLRTREFVMADAYSFHADETSLQETYVAMKDAVSRVLANCGVTSEAVHASCGAMGGDESEERIAPLPGSNEGAAVKCNKCGYAASLQIAEFQRTATQEGGLRPLQEVAVRDGDDADQVLALLGCTVNQLCCTPFIAGSKVILIVAAGNLQLNSEKLMGALSEAKIDTVGIHRGSAEELVGLGGGWDWISLTQTPRAVFVIADEGVRSGSNFVFPSVRSGHYLVNVNSGRDFRVDMFADLGMASDGDVCRRCGGCLRVMYGTEVAHLFKLGASYAAAFGAGIESSKPLQMGCYGIGITRLMAAIVAQKRDEHGIVWPHALAPYAAIIIPAAEDCGSRNFVEELYRILSNAGLDVLVDDSDHKSEKRMAFADLLGIPIKIVASGTSRETVEVRERNSAALHEVHTEELGAVLRQLSSHSA